MQNGKLLTVLAILAIASQYEQCLQPASAAIDVVDSLGDYGWNSGDTRPAAGGAASPAQIAAQIIFMGEAQTVIDASGLTPDPSPTGSLNGRGYVRLDGTNANSGKSDLSYVGALGSTSLLLQGSFFLDYSYFDDPNTQSRTLGLNIGVTGSNSNSYTFVHTNPTHAPNAWNTNGVDADTGNFFLYGSGAPGGTVGSSKSLTDWSLDGTWGSILFDGGASINRVGFNVGSFQRNELTYLDWVETSLLNGGDTIDFQSPVPEPASLAAWSLLGAIAVIALRRRS